MTRHDAGPRRSAPVHSYLGPTRLLAELDVAGLVQTDASVSVSLEADGRAARDTARLGAAIRQLLSDGDRRRMLYQELSGCASASDELVGRWAAVTSS
jgi:hypothetical protein